MNNEKAYLSNVNDMIIFQHNDYIIRFKGGYSLEYFASIKEWDNGYIVVMTKYQHNQELEEEYIDLVPILENLYIEPTEFLRTIKEVRISYEQS